MMKITLFIQAWLPILGCVLLQSTAQAQIDFRKGYIITHQGDTVSGMINFHDGVKSYEICEFRRDDNRESKKYSPGEIAGYGFANSRRYSTRKLSPRYDSATVFVEVIAYGRMILSRYRETFWVEKEGVEFKELRNDYVKRTIDGDVYEVHSNEHIAVFNTIMIDCSDVQPLIQKTQLFQKELVKLVEAYNNCGNKPTDNKDIDQRWLRIKPGIVGGVQFSSIDLSDLESLFDGDLAQLEKEIAPVIGITLDIFSPRISERFVFNAGLWYSSSAYYLQGIEPNRVQSVMIDIDELRLPIGVRYTLAPRKVTPFINVGFSTSVTIAEGSSWVSESSVGKTVYVYDRGELPLKKNQFGLWGGAGVVVRLTNKLDTSIEVRYERTDGIVDTGELRQYGSHISNLQILVALRLNKAQ